jgi:hypothetical protein
MPAHRLSTPEIKKTRKTLPFLAIPENSGYK